MAFDLNTFVKKQTTSSGKFNVNKFLQDKGFVSPDLTTSDGLYSVAQNAGGAVANKATEVIGENPSLLSRVGSGLKKGLGKVLDLAQRVNYASASAVKNVIDDDPNTTFGGGLKSGIKGETKHTYTDVFEEAGWKPTSWTGKASKGVAGFALDVLLDPTTYVTFGAGATAKVTVKVGGVATTKSLSKTGSKLLAKGVAQKAGQEFGEDFVKNAIGRMAEKSPEMYKKFIDQGGIKFFGNTIMSGGRIAGVAKAIPGMSKVDEATAPVRNTLYALFNRDASVKYGDLNKLGQISESGTGREFVQTAQKFRDLGAVRGQDALNKAVEIAKANKLTSAEAEIITNAIESKLPIADLRLENARKLFEQGLGRNLKDELKAGIEVGELPNYVPHILVDEKVRPIPFKPQGVRVSLGASKGRTIGKIGEEEVPKYFHGTRAENLADNSRSIFLTENKGFADSYANAVGAGRGAGKVRGINFDGTEYLLSKEGDKFVSTTGREIPFEKGKELVNRREAEAMLSGASVKSVSLTDGVKVLDLTGKANTPEFINILETTLKNPSLSKADKRELEVLLEQTKNYGFDWGRTTSEHSTQLFNRVLAPELKNKGYSAIKFADNGDNTTMAFGGAWKEFTGVSKIGKGANVEQATIAEINSAFGKDFFDPNIVNTAAIRSVASARAVTAKEFLTETAQKFGTKAELAPTGYIEAGAKELAGLKFHPAIVEQIDKFNKALIGDDATNELLKAFDKAQALWKASVTSVFPAFHGRNAISNVFQNYLDLGRAALSPSRNALSVGILNDNRNFERLEKATLATGDVAKMAKEQLKALSDKIVLTDDFGKKWSFGELRKEMRDRRVAFGDEFTGFLDVRESIQEKLGTAVTGGSKVKNVLKKVNPLSQNNVAFRAGRAVGNAVEQQARVLNFMANLERTGDVVTSAERTKQFLFDYTNLSDFEKGVMRRLIPFYTFTRKNLELQVGQLAKQPGKLATQAKLFTNISKTLSGSSLSEEETKLLPQFLQEGLGIVYKRDGNKVEIINSLGTPIEQIFSNLKPNTILGGLSPIISVPLQVAIGKSFFYEKDLKDVNTATAYKNAPQFLKDYIGLTVRKNKDGTDRYLALNPTRLFIINNIPPASRVIGVVGQLEDENVSGKLKVLRQLTGLKPYGEDLDLQAQYAEKKKIRELQDVLNDSGVAPIFQRSFIPKEN